MDYLLGVVLDLRTPPVEGRNGISVTNTLPARSCAGFEDSSSGREEWKECVTNSLPARSCARFEDSSSGREKWKKCIAGLL
jgi:hypothetical protein